MSAFLSSFNGYKKIQQIILPEKLTAMLDLDDYTYGEFWDNHGNLVSLYVGYYFTADKAYAAHSPTVCYPSQGWQIVGKPIRGILHTGNNTIHYEEIVTKFDERRELVLYWYQAGFHTNTSVYLNKISIGMNKLLYKDEQYGFVRVSVPFGNNTYEENKKNAVAFIESFYPQFLKFLDPGGIKNEINGK